MKPCTYVLSPKTLNASHDHCLNCLACSRHSGLYGPQRNGVRVGAALLLADKFHFVLHSSCAFSSIHCAVLLPATAVGPHAQHGRGACHGLNCNVVTGRAYTPTPQDQCPMDVQRCKQLPCIPYCKLTLAHAPCRVSIHERGTPFHSPRAAQCSRSSLGATQAASSGFNISHKLQCSGCRGYATVVVAYVTFLARPW